MLCLGISGLKLAGAESPGLVTQTLLRLPQFLHGSQFPKHTVMMLIKMQLASLEYFEISSPSDKMNMIACAFTAVVHVHFIPVWP